MSIFSFEILLWKHGEQLCLANVPMAFHVQTEKNDIVT